MAKAKLEIPFSSVSGRLSGDSETYVTMRYGQTVISNYPKRRDPKKITAHQKELNANFAQVVARVKAELSDPVRKAHWQAEFDKHQRATANKSAATTHSSATPRYKTLRGFTIAQLTKQKATE